MTPGEADLRRAIAAELEAVHHPAAAAFATELARMGGRSVASVLFYGSALRTGATDGVLDFYVLVDDLASWPQARLAAWAGERLPPNVEYREWDHGPRALRAKVAIMRSDQFLRHAGRGSLDTSIWARFAQPVGLLWARDQQARDAAVAAVAEAVPPPPAGLLCWAPNLADPRPTGTRCSARPTPRN